MGNELWNRSLKFCKYLSYGWNAFFTWVSHLHTQKFRICRLFFYYLISYYIIFNWWNNNYLLYQNLTIFIILITIKMKIKILITNTVMWFFYVQYANSHNMLKKLDKKQKFGVEKIMSCLQSLTFIELSLFFLKFYWVPQCLIKETKNIKLCEFC